MAAFGASATLWAALPCACAPASRRPRPRHVRVGGVAPIHCLSSGSPDGWAEGLDGRADRIPSAEGGDADWRGAAELQRRLFDSQARQWEAERARLEARADAAEASRAAWFEREMARWDDERRRWDEREATLRARVGELEDLVVRLTAQGRGEREQGAGQPLEGEKLRSDGASAVQSAAAEGSDSGVPAPVGPEIARSMDGVGPAQKQETGDGEPGPSASPSIEASLAAAVAAVDEGDVLSEDFHLLQSDLEAKMRSGTNGVLLGEDMEGGKGQSFDQGHVGEDAETAATGGERVPLEVVKSPPTGPPPCLTIGDDDIFWVAQLQQGLARAGYFPGDDDMEDYVFGEGTLSALLTYQACEGLEETGTADEVTWRKMLGDELKPILASTAPDSTSTESGVETVAEGPQPTGSQSGGLGSSGDEVAAAAQHSKHWPTLREEDGGRHVHSLHVALQNHGYACGEDDTRWWQYGAATANSVRTFQACNGLPESGVCDAQTWVALLGQGASPGDLKGMLAGDSTDEDLTQAKGVYLIGEQRWERPVHRS
ncbi:unnamed protein product [Ostreobium quekettii]|uniref:Peptidoglycan binding-like domain-containing protein n=1 Tax=Ostreobium quekettii TaxID=121088 RepID=A0A8S1IUH2_9CHLO|nr:unnamed protein product [Ostreobium quekettii]